MKEAEYNKAVKANDQLNIQSEREALAVLKEELETAVKAFDAVPANNIEASAQTTKKVSKWQSFFTFKTAANRK